MLIHFLSAFESCGKVYIWKSLVAIGSGKDLIIGPLFLVMLAMLSHKGAKWRNKEWPTYFFWHSSSGAVTWFCYETGQCAASQMTFVHPCRSTTGKFRSSKKKTTELTIECKKTTKKKVPVVSSVLVSDGSKCVWNKSQTRNFERILEAGNETEPSDDFGRAPQWRRWALDPRGKLLETRQRWQDFCKLK